MNKEEISLSKIINWILTTALILAIVYAGHQRYFEDVKCEKWCEEKLQTAQMSLNGQVLDCRVNWSNIFAEEQDYPQNNSLAQNVQNLNYEFQEETEIIKQKINEVTKNE